MGTNVMVVGAGLTGATVARRLAELGGWRVTVVDKRSHVAGNCYDPIDESTGLRFHVHGPHIFHTSSEKVWNFLSRFTQWSHYEHRVLAQVASVGAVPVPCNFTSLAALLGERAWPTVQETLQRLYKSEQAVPVMELLRHPDPLVKEAGRVAYESIFLGYTTKQWGLRPEEVGPSVMSRVPVRMGWDDRYFLDRFQALPRPGYHELVGNMLDHDGIEVFLGTAAKGEDFCNYEKVVFTGAVDDLLGHRFGPLPYRSLRFEYEVVEADYFQPVAQVNFPGSEPWTRITEFKHFGSQVASNSLLAREIPQEHQPGKNEPYYPFATDDGRDRHQAYAATALLEFPNLTLAGRLAEYRYYNMDQAVARGLQVSSELLSESPNPGGGKIEYAR